MSEILRIEDQLKRAFEGEAWHGPAVLELLADVTAARAAAKPLAGMHSIWEIVLHISAWVDATRRRVEGDEAKLTAEQDWRAVGETSEAAWKAAIEGLTNAHRALRETILRLEESRLKDRVPGQQYSVYFLLHGVIQHDLYHAGQIAILKKHANSPEAT